MFEINKIKKLAKEDFEKTWVDSVRLIPKNTIIKLPSSNGKSHILRDMMEKARKILLELGFDEIENRTIFPDSDVFKQYGPETPVILDRAFYLAKLPRQDIGLSQEKIDLVEKLIGTFDSVVLQEILRKYKKGELEGDDFIEEFVIKLNIKTEQATEILEKVFPEFKKLKPKSTNLTLRSHMTAGWYETLSALQDRSNFPLALFSVGPRYRNEQREDNGHLRVHHSASIVIMDPNMSLEAGKKITEKILKKFGFNDVRFELKKATSKYYAKDQELEVFVNHNKGWLEIADIGMYSVISLANFDIKYPVFNFGLGIERIAMVLEKYKDIRKLVHPQFVIRGNFSDQDIVNSISYVSSPLTDVGKKIALAIIETAKKFKDEVAPCEFIAYEDDNILIKLTEEEKDKKLIGPAAFNEIYVDDGNIYSSNKPNGIPVKMSLIESMANLVGYEVENNNKSFSVKKKIVKSLANINLEIPNSISEFIQSNKKKIDIYGAMFVEVKVKYKN